MIPSASNLEMWWVNVPLQVEGGGRNGAGGLLTHFQIRPLRMTRWAMGDAKDQCWREARKRRGRGESLLGVFPPTRLAPSRALWGEGSRPGGMPVGGLIVGSVAGGCFRAIRGVVGCFLRLGLTGSPEDWGGAFVGPLSPASGDMRTAATSLGPPPWRGLLVELDWVRRRPPSMLTCSTGGGGGAFLAHSSACVMASGWKGVGQSRLRPCRVIRMILDLHPCRALVLVSLRMATAAARASVMALWRRGIVWFAVILSDIRRAIANWLSLCLWPFSSSSPMVLAYRALSWAWMRERRWALALKSLDLRVSGSSREWGESNPGSLWESRENLGAAAKSRARARSETESWWHRVNGGGLKGVSSPRLPRNREGLPVATVRGFVGWETRPRCVSAGLSIILATEWNS